MRKILSAFTAMVMALLLAVLLAAPAQAAGSREEGTGETEILVRFKTTSTANEQAALNRSANATMVHEIKSLNIQVLKVKNPKAIEAIYRGNKHVEYVEENLAGSLELVPNDANYGRVSAMLKLVNAEAGWDITTSSDALIAVIDSGVAPHSDLTTAAGYSIYDNAPDTSDVYGHGTNVAGVIGANGNNGVGTTGIIWNANIMPLKITTTNSVSVSNVAAALVYAADSGARVINMSLGFTSDSQTLKAAVDYACSKGCILVAAAGNNGKDGVNYPAAYSSVLAVGSTSNGTSRYSTSNYGSGLDVMASSAYYTVNRLGGYTTASGTSIAAPQVAALAALVLDVAPELSSEQVMALIRGNTADMGAAGYDAETGYGLIDIGATLAAAAQSAGTGSETATSASAETSSQASSVSASSGSASDEAAAGAPPPAAPQPEIVREREKLSFSGSIGKKANPTVQTHSFTAAVAGNIDVTVAFSGKKNAVAASLTDSAGRVVASGQGNAGFTFVANGIAAGQYALHLEETSGANNLGYTAEVLLPEREYEILDGVKTPLGQLEADSGRVLVSVIAIALAVVVLAAVAVIWKIRRPSKGKKREG